MKAPFAFWKPSAAVFDPATLDLSGWWRADYAGAPWAANASAGVSATTGALATAGSDPTAGTTQNGKAPAAFASASSQYLSNVTTSATLFTATAGTISALIYPVSAAAPSGSVFDDPAIYVDAGVAHIGLTYTTDGFRAFCADGATSVTVAAATGSYHRVTMRWNGTVLGLRVDSGVESTTPSAGIVTDVGTIHVGRGYGGGTLDARVLDLMFSPVDLSGSYADIKSYDLARYALAL